MGVRSCRTPSSSLDLNLRHARSPRDSNTTRRHALVYAGHRSCHKRSTLVYAEPASNIQAVGTSSMPADYGVHLHSPPTAGGIFRLCRLRNQRLSASLSTWMCGVYLETPLNPVTMDASIELLRLSSSRTGDGAGVHPRVSATVGTSRDYSAFGALLKIRG
ncbi:unnamed protein product [Pieris macdunnoughi]|uniref:Uncharacterized protein n=1 Tax=Pieris macdunnoughi TaxID=345717 RepID=A0A821T812_9NEOP|nr:unnamed protein product [Pieris macdunnoughi]